VAKQIRRLGVVQTAKVMAVMYGLMGLVFVPFILIGFAFTGQSGLIGFAGLLIFPVLYAIFGFIFVAIGCALYNLVAGWVGGIEFETEP
jgi:hypothetical protein